MFTSRKGQLAAACVALSIFGAAMISGVSVANAQDQPAPVETPAQAATDGDYAVVETFTTSGVRISTEAFNEDGDSIPVPTDFESQGIVVAVEQAALTPHTADAAPAGITGQGSDSGTGGSSSARGCTTLTVSNRKSSLLGFTLFRFHTWTAWCWDRRARTVSSVQTGWYLSDVDWTREWNSMIVDSKRYYHWISGYSTSGYEHHKQGHLQGCLGAQGCFINNYPQNWIRSHSDGTWSWEVEN